MSRISFRQLANASIASVILAFSLPVIAAAQTAAPAPQWLRFNVETVKPDMVQEYEGYKKQLAAAYKKAGLPLYAVLSSYTGNRNEYTTVTFVMKFGDLDSPSPLIKALGDEAFANLVSSLAHCVTSTTWYFSLPWDDVSIDKGGAQGQYFLRTRVPVATGKNPEYRAYLKNELKPVLEKGGVTFYRASAPVFGGPAGTVETLRMLKNLAEIDGGPIQTKVLGAAGAQALAAKAAVLTRGPAQTTILRMRPELSLLPAAMPAK
jgi:hypothetical protein